MSEKSTSIVALAESPNGQCREANELSASLTRQSKQLGRGGASHRGALLTGSERKKFGEGAVLWRRTAIGNWATRLPSRSSDRPVRYLTAQPMRSATISKTGKGILRSLQLNPFPSILILGTQPEIDAM